MNAGRSMLAAVITAPGKASLERAHVPQPGPAEALIRVEGCGLCASNLPLWEGMPWFKYPQRPGVPGHEAWGRVEAVGSEVSNLSSGQRVAFLSDRAFAEYDVAPATSIVALPELLHGKPLPAEPIGCAVNIYRRSEVNSGDTVAIVGAGFLGILLVRLASQCGARVIAISRRKSSLELAQTYGATEIIPMNDHGEILKRVNELTGGRGCERVIEVSGKQWPLDIASEITAERGRLIIAGYHQDGPRQVNMQLWNWRGIDVINAHERDPGVYIEGMKRGVEMIAQGELDPFPLFTHSFSFDHIAPGFEMLRERPDGFVKALVIM